MSSNKKKIVPIGGEPYYSPSIIFQSKKSDVKDYFQSKYQDKEITFTYGGYYSIKLILDEITVSEDEHVLLPSYLCPTILLPFKEKNIRYSFYKITKELKIDTEDLKAKVNQRTKAVFFINYFGFDISIEEKNLLEKLKDNGVILIQDLVQCFFADANMLFGNFAFNSFRKFFPVEGSCIISDKKLVLKQSRFNWLYFFNKLLGRYYRYKHFNSELPASSFLKRFSKANSLYHKEGNSGMTFYDEFILNKFDFKKSFQIRRMNFLFLLGELKSVALFNELDNNESPLVFPIVVKNPKDLKRKLLDKNIFCPVHWNLSEEIDKEQYSDSWWLSEHTLSIPINSDINYTSVVEYLKYVL